ncbi:kinesin light chain [Grosmannia clavigera kw1407]|uniref:Kinesin light chain n=1 Tax=Grosmannia clavigera (strain kw1407 / UAMH 11150) TaxID=655863 RepID=F0XQM0_GROCL|nr:kinesin light chain [Grosmannia clavigera kw1407]EFW99948.1 kinesin light chain [Grosmannia clavigera kw1407]
MKIAITGLGGIGKTQLALEFAFQQKELSDCAVFWISCVNSETIDQAYRIISRELEIPGHNDAQLNVKELLRDYLSSDNSGRWLLVFDNVDDLSVWEDNTSPSSRGLLDYLPKNDIGTIVFTTRDNRAAFKLASPNVVNLSEMDESTSQQLLKNYLGNEDLVKAEEDTRILLERLAYLPLAIVQAASYVNMNQTTLQDYIQLLDKQEAGQIELLSKDFNDDWRYQSIQNSVAKTWLISFTEIKKRDPLASEFLSFMACIDSKDIPRSLLPRPSSLPEAREVEAIGTLTGYSFITKHTTGNAFSMHRLVHIATRNWLRAEETLDTWTDKAVTRLADALLEPDQTDRAQWRSCMPHAHYILTLNAGPYDYNSLLLMLFKRYGDCLYYEGRYKEAEINHEELVKIFKTTLGADHPGTLTSMYNLASVYKRQGRWDEAEKLGAQEMEACKAKLGADHPDTLSSISNLATVYQSQGRWDEAEKLGAQVVEARKTKLGADHPDTLTSMSNLALVYESQGRWDEAEKLEAQVVEARKTKLGADHPGTLTSMSNLASAYRNQGRWDEAEKLEAQVVEARKTKLGADHPDTLTSMSNLALVYESQGRWDEAEKLGAQVVEASKTKLGADHPDTLTSMSNLALVYESQGRWDEAEELGEHVVEAYKTKLGADHPDTLTSMNNVAIVWKNLDRHADALEMMQSCVEARNRVLGLNHPNTKNSAAWLTEWEE